VKEPRRDHKGRGLSEFVAEGRHVKQSEKTVTVPTNFGTGPQTSM